MSALLLAAAAAQAQGVEGFAELRLQGYIGVDGDVPLLVVERLRPSFSAPLTDRIGLFTTVEAGMGQGWTPSGALSDLVEQEGLSAALLAAVPSAEQDNAWLGVSGADDYLSVDRLYVELLTPQADVRIGRQALNWGSGFVVNPSDPFPELLLTEPWKPRSGMNAVRVDLPIGALSGAQLVAGADDAFLHPRLAGRLTLNALQTDFSVVTAWREEVDEGIFGLDIKGTLGVGFWLEGVLHVSADADPYEELALGLDYSLPVLEQLILTAQYYRSGRGSADGQAPTLLGAPAQFAPLLSGRDYLMAAVSAGLTRDLSSAVLWMQNLSDGTAYSVPTISLATASNIDLSLAGQIPLSLTGEGGEFSPSDDDLTVDLPAEDGGLVSTDLGGLVADATVIFWTRFNF